MIFEKTRELSLLKAEQEKAQLVIFDDGLQEKTINYDLKMINRLNTFKRMLDKRLPTGLAGWLPGCRARYLAG